MKEISLNELKDYNVATDNKGNVQKNLQKRNYSALNKELSKYKGKIVMFTKLELLKILNCQGTYNRYQARRQLCEQLEEKTNRIWIQRKVNNDWNFIAIPKPNRTKNEIKNN